MKYTQEIANNYSKNREDYNDTDPVLFAELESIGLGGKRIVDIGCGDGSHAVWMNSMGAEKVIGADVSETMISLASQKARGCENLGFLLADGSKLPIKSASIDLVVSNYVIHYFAEAMHIFNEISRILIDEGYFIGTFNITEVDEGFEQLYNQPMPVRLNHQNGSVVIQNLIKPRYEIEHAIMQSDLTIEKECVLDNIHSVVDPDYPFKQHINKQAVLMTLKRAIRRR